jgi:hypothetical protein
MTGNRLFALGVGFMVLSIGTLFLTYGYENTWRLWRISTISPYFVDCRTFTGCGISLARGCDPLVHNPGDPRGRRLNYPRIWQYLAVLGVQPQHTIYFGAAFGTLFLLSLFLFLPGSITRATACVLLIALFSPAVIFALERGNNDLLIFVLLALAIFWVNKDTATTKALALLAVLCAFVLKLFPIFGAVLFLRERRRLLLPLALLIALGMFAYITFTWHDLQLVYRGTPKDTECSYGLDVTWMNLLNILGVESAARGMVASYAVVLFSGVLAWSALAYPCPPQALADQKALDAFRVGSAVYLGTFLLGSNYDYRLMFLLFTIPQLMAWSRMPVPRTSWIAALVAAAVVLSFWHHFLAGDLGQWKGFRYGLPNWLAFIGLSYLLAWSVPPWVRGACRPRRAPAS